MGELTANLTVMFQLKQKNVGSGHVQFVVKLNIQPIPPNILQKNHDFDMNADSTFQIGHDHTVCEDYAIAGNIDNRITYAIVCDGCSASPDVDFGARVLAMAARETLSYKLAIEDGLFEGMDPNLSAERFGQVTVNKAQEVCRTIRHLHPQALDATCLVLFIQNNQATVMMFGDGVFIHRTPTSVNAVHISLTSGAPDYLAYESDKNRKKAYNALVDNKKIITTKYTSGTDVEVATLHRQPLEPYSAIIPVQSGDVLSVISDGIGSFRKSDNEAMNWEQLVDEFTAYKNFEGQFVQRRIKALKRKCLKENWQHLDDISIASIVV